MNTRGIVFLEYGYLLEAEQDLRRAIKVLPNYLEAHINLSNVLRKKGDFKNAKKYGELAVKLDPNSAAAWNALGAQQMESAKLDEAIASFDKALSLAPKALVTIKNKAKILVVQKKWQEAIPLLQSAIGLQDFEVFSMLSRAYYIVGEVEKAIDPFIEAMRVSNPVIRKNYFSALEGVEHVIAMCDALGVYRSNFSAVAELYQLAIEALPEHTTLINNLAVSQFNQSIYDKSVENLRRLLELDPGNVQARTNLGVSLIMLGCDQRRPLRNLILHWKHDPQISGGCRLMIGEKNRICSWDGIVELRRKVAELLDRPRKHTVCEFFYFVEQLRRSS
ncbi:MAG: tetratricopeptide repeat protein [Polaromonas sp.]|nr:tetratricopeptide repeat protein [Polaromonas sp.]